MKHNPPRHLLLRGRTRRDRHWTRPRIPPTRTLSPHPPLSFLAPLPQPQAPRRLRPEPPPRRIPPPSLFLHLRLPPLFSLNPILSLLPQPFSLLRSMLSDGPFPNHISITSILKSPFLYCCPSLVITKLLHSLLLSSGLLPSPLLFPSFISSYSSCADFSSARQLFDEIPPDCSSISAKTAFISACAAHGLARDAVYIFEKEVKTQETDDMAVTAVLATCAREGLVQEGKRVFRMVKKPVIHHYTCMVELCGKAGHVEEAERLIEEMRQEPDEVLWNALLSVCRAHGRLDVANRVYQVNAEIGSCTNRLCAVY